MRRTVYLSLAALGAASIATAAVMTTGPSDSEIDRRARAKSATTQSDETRATASESATEKGEAKRDCNRRCWLFGD